MTFQKLYDTLKGEERETNKMQLIWCLLSSFYLYVFQASLCPSSGEQECALPHMVFCTVSDGCGCVELGRKLCELWRSLFDYKFDNKHQISCILLVSLSSAYQYVQLHTMKLCGRKPYQHRRRQYLTCRVSVNVFSTSANLSAFQAGTMILPRLSDGPSSLWQANSRTWRSWTKQLCHYWQRSSAFQGRSALHVSASYTGGVQNLITVRTLT